MGRNLNLKVYGDKTTLPEEQLWIAVVRRSLLDLIGADKRAKEDAKEFFASEDVEIGSFRWICHVIGVWDYCKTRFTERELTNCDILPRRRVTR